VKSEERKVNNEASEAEAEVKVEVEVKPAWLTNQIEWLH
jgi:hypothetical protein